jgi:hypothetical protein
MSDASGELSAAAYSTKGHVSCMHIHVYHTHQLKRHDVTQLAVVHGRLQNVTQEGLQVNMLFGNMWLIL